MSAVIKPLKESPVDYGISRRFEPRDHVDVLVERLRRKGFCILESALTRAELADLRVAVDQSYERQCAELTAGVPSLAPKRDANLVLAPLAYDPLFLKPATDPALRTLLERVFGPNFVLLQQNAIINRPTSAHYQVQWHRDLNYQHFTSSEPMALSALYCVDEFTNETGATFVLPGSHLLDEYPSENFVLDNETQLTAPPGSILVFDAMVYHRAGRNVSNQVRRGLNHVIGRPFMAQQIDLPSVLKGRYREDEFLSRYLGYRWNPAPDVRTWRMARR